MHARPRFHLTATLALTLASACQAPEREGVQQPGEIAIVPVVCGSGPSSLIGAFKAPNGATGVGGATVTLSDPAGCTATTDTLGMFRFTGLPAGANVTVTATKGNFTVLGSGTTGGGPVWLVIPADSVNLAYVAGTYDSIEDILMFLGFNPVAIPDVELATTNLAQYDALFLNCTDQTEAVAAQAAIQAYVNGGGTLYASDWAFDYVVQSFPGAVNFLSPNPKVGDVATVVADILDPTLILAVGKDTAEVEFNLGIWVVIDGPGLGTSVLIEGPATFDGTTVVKPFSVQFPSGAGRVLYTSFHNHAQPSEEMVRVLESFVFAL